jgi:hypothetical protein
MRMIRHGIIGPCALLIIAFPLRAQQLARAQRGAHPASSAPMAITAMGGIVAVGRSRPVPRWPFLVGGAVVGSAVGGALIARQIARSDDGMILPVVPIAGAVVAGAGVGMLGGWAISAVVRAHR